MPLINKDAILEPFDFDKVDFTLLPKATLQSPGIILVGEGLSVTPEGILSKTHYNLEDLKDKPLARTNLEVFSKEETNTALQNLKEYTDQENAALNAATSAAIASLSDSTDAAVLAAKNHTDSSISSLTDYTNTEILNLKQYTDDGIEALRVSSSTATEALRTEIQNDLVELQSTIEDEFVEVRSEVAASFTASDQNLQQTATQLLADYEIKIAAHSSLTDNPHAVTKAQVGLGEADNTSDIAKPVSTAQQAALALKLDKTANAASATKLQTSRTISLTGGVTGSVNFDGSANVSIATTITGLGVANGIATLDSSGQVPSTQLPSYVDDVLEYVNVAAFPTPGESGKIYVETTGNTTYRWSGSGYTKITSGEVSSVAGKTGVVTLTKTDVGLPNVDNTADSAKNVASAAKLTTARILTVGRTGKTFDGSANVAWTATEVLPTATSGQFLKFDGTNWIAGADNNTTYSTMLQDEATTGTATQDRLISASVLKSAIQYHSPIPPTFTGTATAGLVPPRVGSVSIKYLREDGTWQVPTNTTYLPMTVSEYTAGSSNLSRLISANVLKDAVLLHGKALESIQGNAATASKLQNPIKINGKDFDGSEDFDIITGSSAFIGSVSWFNGNPMRLPDGYAQGNGQIYNRADYPFMWEAIERGQFEAIDDATWLADPSQRAKYSLGDGSTTFRMPDLNGVQPDSLNAPFLRGKGAFAVGTVLGDAIRDITARVITVPHTMHVGKINHDWTAYDAASINWADTSGNNLKLEENNGLSAKTFQTNFRASNVVPTATENRPISAVGMWIIKVRGDTVASPESQPATLMHNEFHGNQIIHGDMIVTGEVRFGEASKVEVNLPIGFVEWYNGPRTHIRIGTLPSDGQLLKRADYPALWAEIERGAFASVSETDWWATPHNRGSYSLGDGSTTFRMPDLNGVQEGSFKRNFLRGADIDALVGKMRGDAIRDIQGGFTASVPAGHGNYRTGAFSGSWGLSTSSTSDPAVYEFQAAVQGGKYIEGSRYGYYFRASDVVPTAEEVRPVNAMGVWVIRVSGGVPNNTTGTAAGIDTNTFNGHQTMNAGASINGGLTVDGKEVVRKSAITAVLSASGTRQKGVVYYNGPNLRIVMLYVGQGSNSGDTGIKVNDVFTAGANMPNAHYSLTALIPPNTAYSFTGPASATYWAWTETDI